MSVIPVTKDKLIQNTCSRGGFSLLELAVAFAILALLAGGIFVGSDMMQSARLRDVTSDAHRYISAVNQFRAKYNALPGDMLNATEIWGRADNSSFSGQCADPEDDESTTSVTETCNGNGNGFIALDASDLYEIHRAWQHLNNAEMIKGSFTGTSGSGVNRVRGGENAPAGVFKETAYDIRYIDTPSLEYFSGLNYRHVIHFGIEESGNNPAHDPAMSAADAYVIDNKIDDGLPGSGTILTLNNTTHNDCATTDDPTTARYTATDADTEDCAFIFITGF